MSNLTHEIRVDLLRTCFENENFPELLKGRETHDATLKFVAGVIRYTTDVSFITKLVASGLPEEYKGKTLEDVPRMVASAINKGFDKSEYKSKKAPTPAEIILAIVDNLGIRLFHDTFNNTYLFWITPLANHIGALFLLFGQRINLLPAQLLYLL